MTQVSLVLQFVVGISVNTLDYTVHDRCQALCDRGLVLC